MYKLIVNYLGDKRNPKISTISYKKLTRDALSQRICIDGLYAAVQFLFIVSNTHVRFFEYSNKLTFR
jgi:hypothetical protein